MSKRNSILSLALAVVFTFTSFTSGFGLSAIAKTKQTPKIHKKLVTKKKAAVKKAAVKSAVKPVAKKAAPVKPVAKAAVKKPAAQVDIIVNQKGSKYGAVSSASPMQLSKALRITADDVTAENIKSSADIYLKGNNITLNGVNTSGTIYIDPGKNGSANLNNVAAATVKVLSGGQNSIHLSSVNAGNLVVSSDSDVRVETSGTTQIGNTTVTSYAIIDSKGGTLGTITVTKNGNETPHVEFRGNISEKVVVETPAVIETPAGSSLSDLQIATQNPTDTVTLNGTFTSVGITKPANVELAENTKIAGSLQISSSTAVKAPFSAKISSVQVSTPNTSDNVSLSGDIGNLLIGSRSTINVTDNAVVQSVKSTITTQINVAPTAKVNQVVDSGNNNVASSNASNGSFVVPVTMPQNTPSVPAGNTAGTSANTQSNNNSSHEHNSSGGNVTPTPTPVTPPNPTPSPLTAYIDNALTNNSSTVTVKFTEELYWRNPQEGNALTKNIDYDMNKLNKFTVKDCNGHEISNAITSAQYTASSKAIVFTFASPSPITSGCQINFSGANFDENGNKLDVPNGIAATYDGSKWVLGNVTVNPPNPTPSPLTAYIDNSSTNDKTTVTVKFTEELYWMNGDALTKNIDYDMNKLNKFSVKDNSGNIIANAITSAQYTTSSKAIVFTFASPSPITSGCQINFSGANFDENGNTLDVPKGIAATYDGSKWVLGDVTVTPPNDMTINLDSEGAPVDISIGTAANPLILECGKYPNNDKKSAYLVARFITKNASNKNLTWSSDNTDAVTVSPCEIPTCCIINAKGAGTSKIIATTKDGLKTASFYVKVNDIETPPAIKSLSISNKITSLYCGDSSTLSVNVVPTNASTDVTWSSSVTTVATIGADGKLLALAPGTTIITAVSTTDDNAKDSFTLTVNGIPTAGISLNYNDMKNGYNMMINSTDPLGNHVDLAAFLTSSVYGKKPTTHVTWSSSNSGIVDLKEIPNTTDTQAADSTCHVTPLKCGETIVTATPDNNTSISASCKIVVHQQNADTPTFINSDLSDKTVAAGGSMSFDATATVNDNGTLSYQWYSAADSSGSGSKAISGATNSVFSVPSSTAGTYYYLCKVTNTNNYATSYKTVDASTRVIKVTITPSSNVVVTGVTLNPTTCSLNVNDTVALTATVSVTPDIDSNKGISWSSNKPSVATVDTTGKVTAVAAGTANITATSVSDTSKFATCVVTVTDSQSTNSATAITLSEYINSNYSDDPPPAHQKDANGNYILYVYANNEIQLAAAITPDTADKSVTWTSSNSDIATVNSRGDVIAYKIGTTTITATTSNGKSASVGIVAKQLNAVMPSVSSITFNPNTQSTPYLKNGQSVKIVVSATAPDGGTLSYQWYSTVEPNHADTDYTPIAGATSSDLTVTSNGANGMYDYRCEITNTNNNVENTKIYKVPTSVMQIQMGQ